MLSHELASMDKAIDGATKATYIIAASLAVDWWSFLNSYAPAIGAVLGILTFVINAICQVIKTKKYIEREDEE